MKPKEKIIKCLLLLFVASNCTNSEYVIDNDDNSNIDTELQQNMEERNQENDKFLLESNNDLILQPRILRNGKNEEKNNFSNIRTRRLLPVTSKPSNGYTRKNEIVRKIREIFLELPESNFRRAVNLKFDLGNTILENGNRKQRIGRRTGYTNEEQRFQSNQRRQISNNNSKSRFTIGRTSETRDYVRIKEFVTVRQGSISTGVKIQDNDVRQNNRLQKFPGKQTRLNGREIQQTNNRPRIHSTRDVLRTEASKRSSVSNRLVSNTLRKASAEREITIVERSDDSATNLVNTRKQDYRGENIKMNIIRNDVRDAIRESRESRKSNRNENRSVERKSQDREQRERIRDIRQRESKDRMAAKISILKNRSNQHVHGEDARNIREHSKTNSIAQENRRAYEARTGNNELIRNIGFRNEKGNIRNTDRGSMNKRVNDENKRIRTERNLVSLTHQSSDKTNILLQRQNRQILTEKEVLKSEKNSERRLVQSDRNFQRGRTERGSNRFREIRGEQIQSTLNRKEFNANQERIRYKDNAQTRGVNINGFISERNNMRFSKERENGRKENFDTRANAKTSVLEIRVQSTRSLREVGATQKRLSERRSFQSEEKQIPLFRETLQVLLPVNTRIRETAEERIRKDKIPNKLRENRQRDNMGILIEQNRLEQKRIHIFKQNGRRSVENINRSNVEMKKLVTRNLFRIESDSLKASPERIIKYEDRNDILNRRTINRQIVTDRNSRIRKIATENRDTETFSKSPEENRIAPQTVVRNAQEASIKYEKQEKMARTTRWLEGKMSYRNSRDMRRSLSRNSAEIEPVRINSRRVHKENVYVQDEQRQNGRRIGKKMAIRLISKENTIRSIRSENIRFFKGGIESHRSKQLQKEIKTLRKELSRDITNYPHQPRENTRAFSETNLRSVTRQEISKQCVRNADRLVEDLNKRGFRNKINKQITVINKYTEVHYGNRRVTTTESSEMRKVLKTRQHCKAGERNGRGFRGKSLPSILGARNSKFNSKIDETKLANSVNFVNTHILYKTTSGMELPALLQGISKASFNGENRRIRKINDKTISARNTRQEKLFQTASLSTDRSRSYQMRVVFKERLNLELTASRMSKQRATRQRSSKVELSNFVDERLSLSQSDRFEMRQNRRIRFHSRDEIQINRNRLDRKAGEKVYFDNINVANLATDLERRTFAQSRNSHSIKEVRNLHPGRRLVPEVVENYYGALESVSIPESMSIQVKLFLCTIFF